VVAPESSSGAGVQPAATDTQAEADAAREAMIAEAREQGRQAAREEWARLQTSQPAPAAPPPTANRREYAELQAEGLAIQQEDVRIRQAITRDGLTAQNLYDQAELTRRESRFAAQVNLVGLQESERRQAIDSRAPKDDEERSKAFRVYASQNPNADPDMLEMAFATKWAREHPTKAAAAAPAPSAPPGRAAVNVSGPSEVSAREARARTMTREQANQHRTALRAEGRDSEAANFDREIRTSKVLIKG
jgi:hypothetical protein